MEIAMVKVAQKKPAPTAKKQTNTILGSVKLVEAPKVRFVLLARKAATFPKAIGSVGGLVSPFAPSLHFTLFIIDDYSGVLGIDGQLTTDYDFNLTTTEAGKNVGFLEVNFYHQQFVDYVVQEIKIDPPAGMSSQVFAQRLIKNAYNFTSYTATYSPPKNLGGAVMKNGEYNSSSFVAGLLNSVMGYVPKISTPGYQTPGWENPLPAYFFKGEAIR